MTNALAHSNIRTLAVYENENAKDLPCIVECDVGLGKAVLCAVHPEISGEFLETVLGNVENDLGGKAPPSLLKESLSESARNAAKEKDWLLRERENVEWAKTLGFFFKFEKFCNKN